MPFPATCTKGMGGFPFSHTIVIDFRRWDGPTLTLSHVAVAIIERAVIHVGVSQRLQRDAVSMWNPTLGDDERGSHRGVVRTYVSPSLASCDLATVRRDSLTTMTQYERPVRAGVPVRACWRSGAGVIVTEAQSCRNAGPSHIRARLEGDYLIMNSVRPLLSLFCRHIDTRGNVELLTDWLEALGVPCGRVYLRFTQVTHARRRTLLAFSPVDGTKQKSSRYTGVVCPRGKRIRLSGFMNNASQKP